MKPNTLKKILSLLLVICMTASFADCSPGEADPIASVSTQTSDETHPATEKPVAPTEAATQPFAATTPAEEATVPATVEPATAPMEIPEVVFTDVDETVYLDGLRDSKGRHQSVNDAQRS